MIIEKIATRGTTYLVKGVIDCFDHLGDIFVGVFQLKLVLLTLERVVKVLKDYGFNKRGGNSRAGALKELRLSQGERPATNQSLIAKESQLS